MYGHSVLLSAGSKIFKDLLVLLTNEPNYYQNKESNQKNEEKKNEIEIDLDEVPPTFVCPISQEIMVDPVIAGIDTKIEERKYWRNYKTYIIF